MLFTTTETLDETLIRLLVSKERTAKDILATLEKEGQRYTIQALYVVLRRLIHSEVLIKHGPLYSLNEEWRAKIMSKLGSRNTHELGEGESVAYILSSLVHHDLQWKNVVLPLHEELPHHPIFFYNYHYIWMHIGESRMRSEVEYYQSFTHAKRHAFSLVGSKSVHDIAVKKRLQSEYVQWSLGAQYFKKTDYLAVLGDYIIITRLSSDLIKKIDMCYEKSETLELLQKNLQKLGIEKKRIKLIVERNHHKAQKLRKKMSRDFFVPKELVEEFGLY